MNRSFPDCMVLGGKWGDCVQMIGAFREIHRITGQKPNVITSSEFCGIYDGCSFVNAVSVPVRWDTGLTQMKQVAETMFGGGQVLQFWQDLTSPEFKNTLGGIRLEIHGIKFSVNLAQDPHYSASMMRRAGFSWDEALQLRPVFDLRNPEREAELLDQCWPKTKRGKPMLLVAFDGQSSPWGYLPELYPVLYPFYRQFHVVDIGKLKTVRVFDLLILMENAVGLITVDSLCLHLVSATELSYIAFTQNRWLGSVPKGNCVLNIPYADTLRSLPEVRDVLNQWLSERATTAPVLVSKSG